MATFTTKQFSFNNDSFSADASELQVRMLPRIILLKSEKTGRTIRYVRLCTDTDGEGDILAWRFLPMPEDAKKYPSVRRTSVVIFND